MIVLFALLLATLNPADAVWPSEPVVAELDFAVLEEPAEITGADRRTMATEYQTTHNELRTAGDATAFWEFAAAHTWPGTIDGRLLECLNSQAGFEFPKNIAPASYNLDTINPTDWEAPQRGAHPATGVTPGGQMYTVGNSIGPLYAEVLVYFADGQMWTMLQSDSNAANCG